MWALPVHASASILFTLISAGFGVQAKCKSRRASWRRFLLSFWLGWWIAKDVGRQHMIVRLAGIAATGAAAKIRGGRATQAAMSLRARNVIGRLKAGGQNRRVAAML